MGDALTYGDSKMNQEELQPLLTPFAMGPLALSNRVVMAPMTRSRAENPGRVPVDIMAEYYSQRAGAGLIISEGTQVSTMGIGYLNTPGIYSKEQVEGWKKVTKGVHKRGGLIFLQLWHVGRVSHPDFHEGALPVAPTAINPDTECYTPQGLKKTVVPRELSTMEVKAVVSEFVSGAKNAREAGFDGVEIHGANGYLVEQFLRDSANHRTDEYGGSISNRARFLMEIVEGVGTAIGRNRTGVRLSPANIWNIPADSDTRALYDHVIGALSGTGLAYLHLREKAGDVSAIPNMVTNVTEHYRPLFKGTLMTNTSFDRESGNKIIATGLANLVAFGVPFIANPDLVERFAKGLALNTPDNSTFYMGGDRGYIDYPALD